MNTPTATLAGIVVAAAFASSVASGAGIVVDGNCADMFAGGAASHVTVADIGNAEHLVEAAVRLEDGPGGTRALYVGLQFGAGAGTAAAVPEEVRARVQCANGTTVELGFARGDLAVVGEGRAPARFSGSVSRRAGELELRCDDIDRVVADAGGAAGPANIEIVGRCGALEARGEVLYGVALLARPQQSSSPSSGTAAASTRLISLSPNPFSLRTDVTFDVARAGNIEIRVCDVSGRTVRSIVNRTYAPGRHSATWDGTSGDGTAAPPGVYFVKLASRDGTLQTHRLVYLRD